MAETNNNEQDPWATNNDEHKQEQDTKKETAFVSKVDEKNNGESKNYNNDKPMKRENSDRFEERGRGEFRRSEDRDNYRRRDEDDRPRRRDNYREDRDEYRRDYYREDDRRRPSYRDDYRRRDDRDEYRRRDDRDDRDDYRRRDDRDRFGSYRDDYAGKRRNYGSDDYDYKRRRGYDERPRRGSREYGSGEPNETLGIFNLSYDVNQRDLEEHLQEVLKQFEDNYRVRLIMDRHTGQGKGFGFITFKTVDDAKAAKDILTTETPFKGKIYRVDFAKNSARNVPFNEQQQEEAGEKTE